jgi:hypothetical protein
MAGYAMSIMNLCIYNERPSFLKRPENFLRKEKKAPLEAITTGLDMLDRHWRRP